MEKVLFIHYRASDVRELLLIYNEIPFFIESEKEKDAGLLMQIAGKILNLVFRANTKEFAHLHLASVWGGNFLNHCYHIAQEHRQKAKIPFLVMRSLLRETAKIQYMSPQQTQTGPARSEVKILEKHLKLTKRKREKMLYRLLSDSIRNCYEKL
ncbi:DUF2520 domain-containing protein [Bacteroidetes bacterium endosymbiont of Geopemphigus sp.]|uniref:DUF2520 domain-containing protein n=1 Tax=Bacteroidetes bacterium endosymbiont of Geopemphigus sp. TaxID=2047937 RepID=UPI000CD12E25|nr:DUF2520 domain-containing protein [Bacteroidetes bacterium endosymbiont of Geopemphigus sp.]